MDSIDVKVSPGTLPRPFSRAQPGVERGPQRGPKQPKTAPEKPAQNRTPLARRTSDFTFRQAASPSSPSGRPVRAARISRAASTPAKGQASSSIRASPRSSGRVERLSLTRAASAKSAPPSVLGKRTRSSSEVKESLPVPVKLSRELRRLQDTNEFNHIDETPVVYTVWSRGKYVPPSKLRETGKPAAAKPDTKSPSKPAADSMPPAAKRQKTGKSDAKEEITETAPVVKELARKRPGHKQYLESGLYAGQEDNKFPYKGLTPAENKALPKSLYPPSKPNKVFPLPIFNGLRLLANGRDFKLPYDICNPLPPGQPKPEEWRKLTRSKSTPPRCCAVFRCTRADKPLPDRFIGDAAAIYKKSPQYKEEMSKCVCKVEDGCADNCQNRIMLYECDETNCNVGPENCRNRAFADLQERVKGGGKYRIGVEVFKTADRGFGVRSNRCFQAGQIIMEYTGEIITEEECDRRMNEEYKHNKVGTISSAQSSRIPPLTDIV